MLLRVEWGQGCLVLWVAEACCKTDWNCLVPWGFWGEAASIGEDRGCSLLCYGCLDSVSNGWINSTGAGWFPECFCPFQYDACAALDGTLNCVDEEAVREFSEEDFTGASQRLILILFLFVPASLVWYGFRDFLSPVIRRSIVLWNWCCGVVEELLLGAWSFVGGRGRICWRYLPVGVAAPFLRNIGMHLDVHFLWSWTTNKLQVGAWI